MKTTSMAAFLVTLLFVVSSEDGGSSDPDAQAVSSVEAAPEKEVWVPLEKALDAYIEDHPGRPIVVSFRAQ